MIDILIDEDVVVDTPLKAIEEAVQLVCFEAKGVHNPSLCIRFANNDVVQTLNHTWRDKDKVTDVLSFPMQEDSAFDAEESLGDIIMAIPFVLMEAKRLNLPASNHILHLVVHGTLHLLGYDHIEDKDADIMQRLENKVLNNLGLHQPYTELAGEGNI